jgi:hypothetical protein
VGVVDLAGSVVQLLDAFDPPLAHPLDVPHQEPVPIKDDGGGGTSPALVGGGVAVTLALAGGLIWVRERARKAESAALEGDAHAEADEQRPGPAVEPGDHPRPREEPT